jgi:hypothetical protein
MLKHIRYRVLFFIQKHTHLSTMSSISKENVRQPVARSSSPEPAAKKIKITPEKDEKSPGPVYVLKCEFGDPSIPLSSHVKSLKKTDLLLEVKRRGLSTDGSRSVLLDRMQKELPYVRLEMDGRECIQGVISSFLNHFGWDNSHLFAVELPRRGDSDVGKVTMIDFFNLYEVEMIYGQFFQKYGTNLDHWPNKTTRDKHIIKGIQQRTTGGLTMEAISRAFQDPEALADFRKMNGSAFDPMAEAYDYEMSEQEPPQCNVSMQELFLQKGDVLKFTYDMGSSSTFTVTIEDVKPEEVLPEETAFGEPIRARLVGKGKARIPKQY